MYLNQKNMEVKKTFPVKAYCTEGDTVDNVIF